MKVVLSIAGSDSGGGAGIQADLKTFEAHAVFGTTAITSITAQNTCGVRAVSDVPVDMIAAQINAVFDDFDVAAVKIGMLSTSAIVHLVARHLRERAEGVPIVLDPVMVATSGDRILHSDAVSALKLELMPHATIVTPNLDEAEILADQSISSVAEMAAAAATIIVRGARAVLVKGGHLPQRNGDAADSVIDLLHDGEKLHSYSSPFIRTHSTHGTGCTLSSAIAANLALGYAMTEAVHRARAYIHAAIANAPGLGGGNGPLNHSWNRTSSS